MGRRNAPRTEPDCSCCAKKKKKEKTGGGAGRRRKAFLVGSISPEICGGEHNHFFFFFSWEVKRGSKNERADGHSGPYRKVTFERTMAGLFGHVRCYE